ncbi:MAG: RecX family transcriptional regulator [Bacteroidales bacterium]|nr:RecX family transcriptional regulator [Bacteroidales bacterium]MBD5272224.1 RecX family transcriptional regulator [Bacteroides sp.]
MIRKKPITKEAALLKMADLCARGEHCAFEIREKLRKMQLAASDANEIVEYLEENRYIDDSRFARAFARDKVKFSGWGKNKIRMALAMKRIPSAEISSALEEIDPEEYMAVAVNAAKAKARNLDLSDYNDKGKLYRHLASRGFEGSVISKAIQSIV